MPRLDSPVKRTIANEFMDFNVWDGLGEKGNGSNKKGIDWTINTS